jgi:ferredoxin
MRVYVDENKCNSAGICVKKMPNVFRFNVGNKKARVIMNPIPLQHQVKVLELVPQCPVNAIRVEFDDFDDL